MVCIQVTRTLARLACFLGRIGMLADIVVPLPCGADGREASRRRRRPDAAGRNRRMPRYHTTPQTFATVEKGVQLEVFEWGGEDKPATMVLFTGPGGRSPWRGQSRYGFVFSGLFAHLPARQPLISVRKDNVSGGIRGLSRSSRPIHVSIRPRGSDEEQIGLNPVAFPINVRVNAMRPFRITSATVGSNVVHCRTNPDFPSVVGIGQLPNRTGSVSGLPHGRLHIYDCRAYPEIVSFNPPSFPKGSN
jgi:hypothetical protein